jgi:O-antigen/teichoic acid export membrane protein
MRAGVNLARRAAGGLLHARGGIMAMLQTLIAQAMTVAVNFGTGVITARLLGTTGRGEFAAASLWLMLPSMIAISGVQNALVFEARRRPEAAQTTSFNAFVVITAVFVPAAAICLLALPRLMTGYPPAIVHLAFYATLISMINAWTVAMRQTLLAARNFRAYNTSGYGSAFLYLLLLIGLICLHAVTPESAVWAQIAASTLMFLWTFLQATRGWHWRDLRPFQGLRPLCAYSLRAAPIDLVSTLAWNVDRLVLVGLISPAAFGLYAVSISFSRVLMVLQVAISSVMFADLASRPRAEIELFTHRAFRLMLWALVVADLALCLFDRKLLAAVYGGDFASAVPIFRVLLVDASLACLSQVVMQTYMAAGVPAYASTIQVVSFVVTLGMMFVLAPRYDGIGAAAALAIGSICKTMLLIFCLPRIGVALPSPLPQLSDLDGLLEKLRASRSPAAEPPSVKTANAR